MAVVILLLATGASARRQQDAPDTGARGVVLQGCVVAAGRASAAGRTPASAPTFILETAPDAGQTIDRSGEAHGQSGYLTGQRQTPTGQQTQAGQEPMAAMGNERTKENGVRTYRLATTGDSVQLADYIGHRVEVHGHLSSAPSEHRRHDGQLNPQGIVDPLTGTPGPRNQAGQPAPHYTSPDATGDVSGTLTVTSVRVLSASCTQNR